MTDLPYMLRGTVVPGKHLGTRLGFPTANIAYNPAKGENWPQEGVYIGVATLDGDATEHLCILNQGKHPTAPGGLPTVEAHLLFYPAKSLYGQKLTLTYIVFLRPETKFPSLDALRAQLACDRATAQRWAVLNMPALIPPTESD